MTPWPVVGRPTVFPPPAVERSTALPPDELALLLTLVTVTLAWLAVLEFVRHRAAVARARELTGERPVPVAARVRRLLAAAETAVARSGPGRVLAERLALAGLPVVPLRLVVAVLAATVLAHQAVGLFLPVVAAWLAAAAVPVAAWLVLRSLRARRGVLFRRQVADVADVLANLAGAGLSLPAAVGAAVTELDEPARGELRHLAESIAVGRGVEASLRGLAGRLPSRDLTVLVGTLLIQSRGGGDLVTALRGIADTLRDRQQVQREVDTALSSAKANALAVGLLGVVVLVLLNVAGIGVERLFTSALGLLVVAIAGVLATIGAVLIVRTVRIEA